MAEQPSPGISLSEFLRTTKAIKEGKGWLAHCPCHDDQKRSLSINLGSKGNGTQNVLVFCHVCGGETFPRLRAAGFWPIRSPSADEARIASLATPQADEHPDHVWVPTGTGDPPSSNCPAGFIFAGVWVYKDIEGRLIGTITRFDNATNPPPGKKREKIFIPTFFFKKAIVGGEVEVWLHKAPTSVDSKYPVRPLYGLWKLKSRTDATILLVEGEKVADAAQNLFPNYVTLSPMGGLQGFTKTDLTPLIDRTVIIWPDHDETWLNNISVWAARLQNCRKLLHVRLPPTLPPKWDLADPTPDGVDLQAIVDDAVLYDAKGSFTALITIKDALDLFKFFYAVQVNEGQFRYVFAPNGHEFGQEVFDLSYKHVTQGVGVSKPSVYFASTVLGQTRTCLGGMISVPNGPEVVKTERGEMAYNTYKVPTLKPKAGDVTPWLTHLEWLLNEQDRTELICRFANLVQRPQRRPLSMYLLIGAQRIGKTMLFDMMEELVGRRNFIMINPGELIEQYNGSIVDKLLVVCNELLEHNRFTFYERIKAMITDSHITRKEKYKSNISVPNYMHMFATTNHEVAVTLPNDTEGRFYVAQCLPREPRPREYYTELYSWGAANHATLLSYLQGYDLGDWIPEHRPITTEAKRAMAAGGIPAYEREYLHLLNNKLHPLNVDLFSGDELASLLTEAGALKRSSDRQLLRELVMRHGGGVHVGARKFRGVISQVEMFSVRHPERFVDVDQVNLWSVYTKQNSRGELSI